MLISEGIRLPLAGMLGFLLAVALLAGCSSVLFETESVFKGSYRGLDIGATKEATLESIRKLEAYAVMPIPAEDFSVTKSNIEELVRIENTEGIRLTNYRGLAIDLFFRKRKVARIRRSVPAKDNAWFHEGEPQADVRKKLEEILMSDEPMGVFPIVYYEGNGWVELNMPTPEILGMLSNYQAWKFEVSQDKPAGAFFEVFFKNDRLVRVDYRRARIRLE